MSDPQRFAVEYHYGGEASERDRLRPAHRAFLGELYERGTLLLVGPFADDGPAGAWLIVQAGDARGALELLDSDPFHTAGLIASRTARPWTQVYGPF